MVLWTRQPGTRPADSRKKRRCRLLAMLKPTKVAITIERPGGRYQGRATFATINRQTAGATYVFPVPKAPPSTSSHVVNGKETTGELVEAQKARDIYTSIVRRTRTRVLLEYIATTCCR